MSETVDRIMEEHDAEGQVVATRTVRYEFNGSELLIGEVRQDDDNNEVFIPGGYQPWQCMPDGTRQAWANATDAFAWADAQMGIS